MLEQSKAKREKDGGEMGGNRYNLDLVETTRERTFAMVADLNQSHLDYSPSADTWSAGEILDHLIRSDRSYRGEIKKLVDRARSGKTPTIQVSLSTMGFSLPLLPRSFLPLADVPVGFFNLFIPNIARETMLRNPWLRAEAPSELRPERNRPGDQLRRELQESLNEMSRLFQENADLNFSSFRHYHPLFGYNGVAGILRLLAAHEQRHQRQLAGLLQRHPLLLNRQGAGAPLAADSSEK
jgi:hypothetical protein